MNLRSHNFYLSFLIFFIFFFYTSCSYLEDDSLVFENPYINLPSIGQNSASGYLLISNRSKDFYSLSNINCEGIRKTVFHKSERDPDTDIISMVEINEIVIAPYKDLNLIPGFTHLMLMGIEKAMELGGSVHCSLFDGNKKHLVIFTIK
tara:strand:- start:171 stop:617 length:447 start_codon:yes stop_codon:yes gene_type:complete